MHNPPLHYLYTHILTCSHFLTCTHVCAAINTQHSLLKEAMKENFGEKFSQFFDIWACQYNDFLQQLLSLLSRDSIINNVVDQQELQILVSKVTQHHKEYYTVKWALAHEDVLAFFSPVWLTPLEAAYSWITGWKPSTLFKILDKVRATRIPGPSLAELTQDQVRKIDALRGKIRLEEEKVEREMERQQVSVAERKMVELAKLTCRVKNGSEAARQVEGLVDVAFHGLEMGLERVMKAADCVRLKALKGVLEVLSPLQSVEFLAGASMFQLQLRQWGTFKMRINNNG